MSGNARNSDLKQVFIFHFLKQFLRMWCSVFHVVKEREKKYLCLYTPRLQMALFVLLKLENKTFLFFSKNG